MVAIKILSKEDVIAAYLCSLGFPQSHIENLVDVVKAKLNLKSDNADELIKEIDVFLLNMAKKVTQLKKLPKLWIVRLPM